MGWQAPSHMWSTLWWRDKTYRYDDAGDVGGCTSVYTSSGHSVAVNQKLEAQGLLGKVSYKDPVGLVRLGSNKEGQ